MTVRRLPFTLILCCTSASLSCSEEKIRTYRVATGNNEDKPAATEVAAAARALRWQVPEGWQEEAPGQFQTALYRLGPESRVSVSSLPGDAGGESANVNRWRQQIGLPPLGKIDGEPIALEGSDVPAKWFELKGEQESILAAIVTLGSETWFLKLSAPTKEVDSRREAFTSFLKSIRVAPSTPAPAAAPPSPGKPGIALNVPDGWVKSEGSSMRVASFRIPGTDGPDGDVSVVPLAGEAGSTLDNVNRWRAQLRLPALESEDDPALGSVLNGSSGPLLMTHMFSEEALFEGDRRGAISTAILKTGDFTWFFKLAGEAELVRRSRDEFESFVRSAKVP
jgi:hypothetical protein